MNKRGFQLVLKGVEGVMAWQREGVNGDNEGSSKVKSWVEGFKVVGNMSVWVLFGW